jgi:murein tripeptide amidase MpaA
MQDCNGARKVVRSNDPYIYSLEFASTSEARALIIFGEHARELISVETGLALVKKLCSDETKQIRKKYSITVMINMNPNSRMFVEKGHSCLRENQQGVDLNRNYAIEWKHVIDHKN